MTLKISRPYVMFLGDAPDHLAIKTAQGVVDWRRDWCVGEIRLEGCDVTTGLTDVTIAEAVAAGAKTLVIGVVNPGGVLPDRWIPTLVDALDAGLDLASGLHTPLAATPAINEAARRNSAALHDVRLSKGGFATGKGRKRPGKRVLTVGTDCSVGKKYTALALHAELERRGVSAAFRATGQTGILIAGGGVAIDAVVADFISGAAESLSPDAAPDHWDVIEGQGSLFHPSFAGVSLGLLHGSQPDALVLCHEPVRSSMRGVAHTLPGLQECIDCNVRMGRLTNSAIQCVGVAVNTSRMSRSDAASYLMEISGELGLPAVDPIADGVAPVVDRLLAVAG